MLIILRLVHGLPEYKIVSVGRQTGDAFFFNTDAQSRGGGRNCVIKPEHKRVNIRQYRQ